MTTSTTIINTDREPDNHRLLIVDDDPLILELLGIFIASYGYEYEAAGDGREAMEKIDQGDFAIVITDMIMPNMDGMQLLRHIHEQHPGIGVIVVTGHTGTFSYTDVIKAGASDFISKPFNSDELEAKINRIFREQKIIRELEYLSNCDALTRLYNRRNFDEKLRDEARRADRQGYPLFLAMLDIDRFKEYNDTFGHQAGDEVLRCTGAALQQCIRKNVDGAFRLGGDEFALILPQIDADQARQVASRVLNTFQKNCVYGETGLSIGLARFNRRDGAFSWEEDLNDLISRADKALYRAKAEGRNRTVCDD